jgi:hypothetical protein
MAINFWRKGVRYQKALFVAVLAVSIVVFIPVVYFVVAPAVPWFFNVPAVSVSH